LSEWATKAFQKVEGMRGDLLFYTPKDWIGKLVAWATNGPYCHVAVDLGDGTKIEADWNGIVQAKVGTREPAAHVSVPLPDPEAGITWLQKQLGNPYGKEDIFNQVLRLMGLKFYFGEPKRYDCSDLAADYLVHAGAGSVLGSFEDRLHLITPNDLARCVGASRGK
jgi:hypothetical protein